MTAPIVRRRPRRGFSLPELLISMVLISIIGIALTRLVVTESRFNNRQVLQRNARGVSRGALNIMMTELRMAEQSTAFSTGSTPSTNTMVLNIPWAVGIRCGLTTIAVMPVDSISEIVGRSNVAGIGLRQANGAYSVTNSISLTSTTNAAQCTGAGLTVSWGSTDPMSAMQLYDVVGMPVTVVAGQPVMLYYRVRYRLDTSTMTPGRIGLYRRVGSLTEEEIVGPFQTGSGFRYYEGTDRMPKDPSAITSWSTVSGVQLNLVGESELQSQGSSTPERANLSTAIFFRNRL